MESTKILRMMMCLLEAGKMDGMILQLKDMNYNIYNNIFSHY